MKRLISIVDKLYLSVSIILTVVLSFFGYFSLQEELNKTKVYEKVYSVAGQVEEDLKKGNAFSPDLYLANQASRVVTLDFNKFTKETNRILTKDNLCFQYNGELQKMNQYSSCWRQIDDFERGNIVIGISKLIGAIIIPPIILFLFRKWTKWIFSYKDSSVTI